MYFRSIAAFLCFFAFPVHAEELNAPSDVDSDLPGMMFGKRELPGMMFGKREDSDLPGMMFGKREDSDLPGMMFGKREDSDLPGMMFGKRELPGMMFGKREDSDLPGMMFGKRNLEDMGMMFGKRPDATQQANADELYRTMFRTMHGKRDMTLHKVQGTVIGKGLEAPEQPSFATDKLSNAAYGKRGGSDDSAYQAMRRFGKKDQVDVKTDN